MIKAMKDFQIPMRVEIDKETASATFGRFTTEAYERGFGTTVGNALRRVLLSSLTGAAVTTVKIEGVLHEFSTIPGVTEDVTSIILNVKGLRLALHTDKPKTIRLKKKGPGEAKGSDIIHDADISILTPNLHIATLDKDATLDMEMTVKHGRGYVPAERNKEEGLPIGVIAIDSIFSPIKRVNFHVENARVGRMTDYDKLTLEVWTDGTISPSDALSTAAGEENVLVQLNNLSTHPTVAALLAAGELRVFGWYYDIGAGRILQYDQSHGQFVDLGVEAQATAPLPIRSAVRTDVMSLVRAS